MDAQERVFHNWEDDPFCPVDWRFRDAHHRIAKQPLEWADRGDPVVAECVQYLKAVQRVAAVRSRKPASMRWPLTHAAIELAEGDGLLRAEIQARLLAGQTDEEIASCCGVPAEIINRFEQIFFFVRRWLRASDYLTARVIGLGIYTGFSNDDVDHFWRWCASAGGPLVVDVMTGHLRRVLAPGEPPTLLAYFRPSVPLAIQGLVAARTLPPLEQTADVWTECQSRLAGGEDQGDEDAARNRDVVRSVLIQLAQAHLAGRPLPIRPVRPAKAAGSVDTSRQRRAAASLGQIETVLAEIGRSMSKLSNGAR